MATRQQLYDTCLIEMGMDTQDRRFSPRVVYMVIDTVRSQLLPDYVATYGESALELLCLTQIFPLQFNKVRNMWYIPLPYQILGGADRSGLIQISLPQEERSSFIAVQLGMLSVYSRLEAGGAAGRQLYFVEGSNIFFPNLQPGITDILIKAIPTTYDLLDDNEQVPMPAEFLALVIAGAKDRLMPQKQGVAPTEDKQNDTRDAA